MIKTLVLTTALISCATSAALAADNYDIRPERDVIGRTYHYVRSNTDGSMPETVSVHRIDRENLEVYKSVGRCTRAALVTAEMDFDQRSASRITGGQLQPNAEHMEFAFLTYDAPTGDMAMTVNLPDMTIETGLSITPGQSWHLYDFDFASLTVLTPHLAEIEAGFEMELPLLWADPSADELMRDLGRTTARFAGPGETNGRAGWRFDVSGGANGVIWLDQADGHILLAELDQPNHPGYTDFRLELTGVEDHGRAGWDAYLTAHYAGCEG